MDRAILLRSVRRMVLLPTAGAIFPCLGCGPVRPELRRSIGNGTRAKEPVKFDLFRLSNIPSGRKNGTGRRDETRS